MIAFFILFGITSPKEDVIENKTVATTEKTTLVSTNQSSSLEPELLEMVVESRLESNEDGLIKINGTTEPDAVVKIESIGEVTSDSNGYFEYEYTLPDTSDSTVKISVSKDGLSNYSYVELVASSPFISKKDEETRIAEENKKAEELASQTAAATAAVEAAELTLSRENYAAALASVNSLESQNPELANRLAAVDETIRSQEAAAAAAEAENQQAAALQEQADSQTVLVTKTGAHYHTRKCGNGTYTPATLQEAKNMGLTPCSKCFG